jgi:hypothetical protein
MTKKPMTLANLIVACKVIIANTGVARRLGSGFTDRFPCNATIRKNDMNTRI